MHNRLHTVEHKGHGSGIVRSLGRRAETIRDEENKKKELDHLRETFRRKGYPNRIIERNLRRPPRTTPAADEEGEVPATEKPKLLYTYHT